jgi:hypothetical protein
VLEFEIRVETWFGDWGRLGGGLGVALFDCECAVN